MRRKLWCAADVACAAVAAGLTFAVCYLFALRGVDPHHDGWMLKTAVDVARGVPLFSGTYTQYGPLYVYILALAVKLFGETVAAIQLATCLAYAGAAVAMYRILRRFVPRLVACLCPLVAIGLAAFYFWNFHPWSSVFSMLTSLLVALFLVRFAERGKVLDALLAGVFAGAGFVCRQPALVTALAGAVVLIGMGLSGFFRGAKAFWKALVAYLLGFLAVCAAFFMVVLIEGSLTDWWIQFIRNAFAFASEPTAETAAKQPDRLLDFFLVGVNGNPMYDWIFRVLTYGTLCYLAVLVVLVFIKKKGGTDRAPLFSRIAFAAIALAGWAYYFPTLCYRHMIWADYPMVGVLGLALFDVASLLLPKRKNEAARARMLALVTAALLLAVSSTNLLVRARLGKARLSGGGTGASFKLTEYAEEDTVLRYERADYGYLNGLYLSERETRFYNGLFDAVGEAQAAFPGKNLVNTTPNALFSVFSSDNVHPGAFDTKSDGYPAQTEIVADYIARERPILIATRVYDGYDVAAYLTDYNGDAFRFEPVYVLTPSKE